MLATFVTATFTCNLLFYTENLQYLWTCYHFTTTILCVHHYPKSMSTLLTSQNWPDLFIKEFALCSPFVPQLLYISQLLGFFVYICNNCWHYCANICQDHLQLILSITAAAVVLEEEEDVATHSWLYFGSLHRLPPSRLEAQACVARMKAEMLIW